jgi:hypothetical protein
VCDLCHRYLCFSAFQHLEMTFMALILILQIFPFFYHSTFVSCFVVIILDPKFTLRAPMELKYHE